MRLSKIEKQPFIFVRYDFVTPVMRFRFVPNRTQVANFFDEDEIRRTYYPECEALIKQVKHGRFVLLPITDETRGHGTHSLPTIWGPELIKFLAELK